MEDKVLIESERKGLNFLKYATIVSGGTVIFGILLNLLNTYTSIERSIYFLGDFIYDFWYFILCTLSFISPLCIVSCLIFLAIYLDYRKCHLCVTEKNIKGTAHWGKKVVLPLYMVSAYSTRKFFWTISVSTASGTTKFSLIKNYNEIGKVLEQTINERQANTQKEVQPTVSINNTLDDLIKLKTLLDMGAITQEEFEAKKKQLLDL